MTTLTRADWEARAKDLKIEGRAFVNGEYSNAASGETFDCLSPVDGCRGCSTAARHSLS